jgi:putative acyl-CoA dehydrogenase
MKPKNPGLEAFDLTDYKGLKNQNFYKKDGGLQRILHRYLSYIDPAEFQAIEEHISSYGEKVGGVLNELTEKSHKEGKYGEIQKYDKTGNRIDEIIYCQEQLDARRISYEHGVVNLDFHSNWKYEFRTIHRYALNYLMNLNGEGGVACPLAMTEGMIYALKNIGSEEQKKKYLPLVAGENSKSYFMAGQYVTERVGGSNVGANRTIARKSKDGKWILNGEKWFCSNPGDLWVTTAKIEGTNIVGMFLVPRYKSDGTLNGHHILRKKDIIGSRGKLTVEIIYEDLEAEEFGRPAHGLVNLIKYIIKISRLHVGIGACGNSRRALWEAIEYANYRSAYGKNLLYFPIYSRTLLELCTRQNALLFSNFRSISYWEKNIPAEDITIPLLKYKSSSLATYISHEAILALGGNGIIGDFSPLPRILNDSIINESWEGTHFLLTDHVLHALDRKKSRESFLEQINHLTQKAIYHPQLQNSYTYFKEKVAELERILQEPKEAKEINRIYIADLAYNIFSLAQFLEESIFDLENQIGDSIFIDFLNVYVEILKIDNSKFLPKDSILYDLDLTKRILSF